MAPILNCFIFSNLTDDTLNRKAFPIGSKLKLKRLQLFEFYEVDHYTRKRSLNPKHDILQNILSNQNTFSQSTKMIYFANVL